MKKTIKNLAFVLAILIAFCACNQTKKQSGYTVKGLIEGLEDATLLIKKDYNDPTPKEVKLTDGSFEFSGEKLNEPVNLIIEIKDKNLHFGFFVENGEITYKGKVAQREFNGNSYSYIEDVEITGCEVNQHKKYIAEESTKLRRDYRELRKLPEKEQMAIIEKDQKAVRDLQLKFIKEHPNAYYSGVLISRMVYGADAAGIKEMLNLLDPDLNTSHTRELRAKAEELEKTDVKPEDIIKAKNVSYKVDDSFAGKEHKDIVYLGVMANDNVCFLTKEGEISIVDAKGKPLNSFKPEFKSTPTTMAVDEKDQIYVMVPVQQKVKQKYRGKTFERLQTLAYECKVFDLNGKELNHFELDGVKAATGARIMDGKLLIADFQNRMIGVFNPNTGAKESAIEGMRPCCGILDFSVNDQNQVLVANLGAFRVQSYDLSGKNILAFGKRGKAPEDFHGCCNPVSVAFLSNGAIVTVEKDPTRVKIYSNDGAMHISGIEELVKGCSYIPMIVDSKDNLYLASPKKGMIKCVSTSNV